MSIHIAMLEDHQSVLQGYLSAFENIESIQVIATYTTIEDMMQALPLLQEQVQVIILDLIIRGVFSFDLIAHIKNTYPDIGVLMLSGFCSDFEVIAAIKQKADGYISKLETFENVVKAIIAIYQGHKVFPKQYSRENMASIDKMIVMINKLNNTEKQFIQLFSHLKSCNDIAQKMNLSVRTIHGYRERLYEKFEVNDKTAFVLKCYEYHLIESKDSIHILNL